MKKFKIILLTFILSFSSVSEKKYFSNTSGEILDDLLIGFNYETKDATFERSGKIPLETFSDSDKEYILKWNETKGFLSSFRFKILLEKKRWDRTKSERSRTPFYMDVFEEPFDEHLKHKVTLADDYEEYNSISLETHGFEINLKNQNLHKINGIIVESKIIYEKQRYETSNSLFNSEKNQFEQIISSTISNLKRDEIPSLIPGEDITLYSAAAVLARQILNRDIIIDQNLFPTQEGVLKGFGNWEEHNRERRDKLIGVWFRVGITNENNQLVWRNKASPESLMDQSWDSY